MIQRDEHRPRYCRRQVGLKIAMAIRAHDGDPCSSAETKSNQSSGESVDALAQVRVAQANGSAYDGLVFRTIAAGFDRASRSAACAAHRSSLDVTLVDRLLASVGLLNRLRNLLIGVVARQPRGKLQPICNANLCVNPAEVTVYGARG